MPILSVMWPTEPKELPTPGLDKMFVNVTKTRLLNNNFILILVYHSITDVFVRDKDWHYGVNV